MLDGLENMGKKHLKRIVRTAEHETETQGIPV